MHVCGLLIYYINYAMQVDTLKLGSSGMKINPVVGNGNNNARVLNEILRRNKSIKKLDISNTGMQLVACMHVCVRLIEDYDLLH
jgi:hypothetical protein